MQPFQPIRARVAIAITALALSATPAHAVDVIADDTLDVYAISGAVILDGSYASARDAAVCGTCHWRIRIICPPQTLDARVTCSLFPCASANSVAEVWRADAPTAPPPEDPLWRYDGLVCLSGAPTAAATIADGVRDVALRAVPALHPTSQPGTTTLTGLPTLFRSGQPAGLRTQPAAVGGVEVQVVATPTWLWDFGQGPSLATSDPGAGWPDGRVRHTYPRRGIYRIRVTTTWHAVYEARGIPDLPVDGVITQSTWFDLRVREARRFLRKPRGV